MGWRVMGDGVIGKTKDDVVSLMAHHPSPNEETTMSESKTGFTGWAILELMGRRRMGGRVERGAGRRERVHPPRRAAPERRDADPRQPLLQSGGRAFDHADE